MMSEADITLEQLVAFIDHANRRYVQIALIRHWFTGCEFRCVEDDKLSFTGDEYWNYGGRQFHEEVIPASHIFCSEEDFQSKVLPLHRGAREQEEHEARMKAQQERERAELHTLSRLPCRPEGKLMERYQELRQRFGRKDLYETQED